MDASGNRLLDQVVNTTSLEFAGMPAGQGVAITCDGDVLLEWWIPAKGDYDGTGETIEAPGGTVEFCPHNKARLTTAGPVNVGIVKVEKQR